MNWTNVLLGGLSNHGYGANKNVNVREIALKSLFLCVNRSPAHIRGVVFMPAQTPSSIVWTESMGMFTWREKDPRTSKILEGG